MKRSGRKGHSPVNPTTQSCRSKSLPRRSPPCPGKISLYMGDNVYWLDFQRCHSPEPKNTATCKLHRCWKAKAGSHLDCHLHRAETPYSIVEDWTGTVPTMLRGVL